MKLLICAEDTWCTSMGSCVKQCALQIQVDGIIQIIRGFAMLKQFSKNQYLPALCYCMVDFAFVVCLGFEFSFGMFVGILHGMSTPSRNQVTFLRL